MEETAEEAPRQAVALAEDLLKHVDLERLGSYASAATAALVLFRRHPWLMVAAGAGLAAVGAWQITRRRSGSDSEEETVASNGHLARTGSDDE